MTLYSQLPTSPITPESYFRQLNSTAHPTMFFFKNRPGPATAECPGTAVHLQCALHASLGPDTRLWAASSGQLINE